MGVKHVLLIYHGDAGAAILPSPKIGFEFTRIINTFLMDEHEEKESGIYLACVSGFGVNNSHFLSDIGADTTTMMVSWM